MRSDLLDPALATELQTQAFSYPDVGATLAVLPAGYQHLRRDVTLGNGQAVFKTARTALFGWHMHRQAGLRIQPSAVEVEPGAVAMVRVGVGPVTVKAPVRILYIVDEPDRAGFGYGTLPGHPESGEEAFMIDMAGDGTVTFTVTAFSKPATRLAHGSGSLGRALQHRVTDRYLAAMIGYCRPESR